MTLPLCQTCYRWYMLEDMPRSEVTLLDKCYMCGQMRQCIGIETPEINHKERFKPFQKALKAKTIGGK